MQISPDMLKSVSSMMSSMSPEMMQSMMAMAGGSAAGAAPTAGNAATASQQPAPGTNTSPMHDWHAWTLCTGAYVWVDERCNAALPPFSMLNRPLSTLYNRLSCLMLQTQLCQAVHALRYRFNPRRLCHKQVLVVHGWSAFEPCEYPLVCFCRPHASRRPTNIPTDDGPDAEALE